MGYLRAKDIVVEFPTYGSPGRSLKRAMVQVATGGIIAADASQRLVVRALDRINLECVEGDRVGLVGHNGSGKTTLLRVLAGTYEPVSGELEVRGNVASMLNIWLGMDLEATGYENIYMRGAIMGLRRPQVDELMDDIVAFTELGDYLSMPMRTYSSGMALRLAFAVSTSVPTDIILMDEWLSVGDAAFTEKSRARLNRMVDRAKILVIATHDESLVRDVCNKVVRLEHGSVVSTESLSRTSEPQSGHPRLDAIGSGK
jgi:lipopolysaccharide transport system ATP-binding protein